MRKGYNEFGFAPRIAEFLGDPVLRLPQRVVKASAGRTMKSTVVQRWEEKNNWNELSRTPREEGGQLSELTGREPEWNGCRKDGFGQGRHIGTGLSISEATNNFEKSCVSWGHVRFRCQKAEDGERKEISEIMNFDREEDCREYPEEGEDSCFFFRLLAGC